MELEYFMGWFFDAVRINHDRLSDITGRYNLLIAVSMIQRKGKVRDQIAACPYVARVAIWYGLFLVVLLTGVYGIGYEASQFIYNQF